MFLFILRFFSLFCILNSLEHVDGRDFGRYSARIIRGTDADIKDFPYYAGLFNCGATILSENWVITTAHCVYPRPPYLNYIWVGGESFRTSKLVTFDRIVVHDKISFETVLVNDIALLHLTEPLNFTDKIRPVELPTHEDLTRSNPDTQLVFVGRGLDEYRDLSYNLKKMDVLRLSTEECLSYMPYDVRAEVEPVVSSLEKAIICTKRANSMPGLCEGDSGSPLVQGNTLVGMASFIGAPCEVATLGFYVNVVNYVPWIKSVTGLK